METKTSAVQEEFHFNKQPFHQKLIRKREALWVLAGEGSFGLARSDVSFLPSLLLWPFRSRDKGLNQFADNCLSTASR